MVQPHKGPRAPYGRLVCSWTCLWLNLPSCAELVLQHLSKPSLHFQKGQGMLRLLQFSWLKPSKAACSWTWGLCQGGQSCWESQWCSKGLGKLIEQRGWPESQFDLQAAVKHWSFFELHLELSAALQLYFYTFMLKCICGVLHWTITYDNSIEKPGKNQR